jgi:hypothetical protein
MPTSRISFCFSAARRSKQGGELSDPRGTRSRQAQSLASRAAEKQKEAGGVCRFYKQATPSGVWFGWRFRTKEKIFQTVN